MMQKNIIFSSVDSSDVLFKRFDISAVLLMIKHLFSKLLWQELLEIISLLETLYSCSVQMKTNLRSFFRTNNTLQIPSRLFLKTYLRNKITLVYTLSTQYILKLRNLCSEGVKYTQQLMKLRFTLYRLESSSRDYQPIDETTKVSIARNYFQGLNSLILL